MSVCRLFVVLFLSFGLTVVSVYGEVPSDDIVFPESLSSRYQHSSWDFNNERPPPRRNIRQGNRRPRPPMPIEGDQFGGFDPQGNNRPFGGNQGQSWSNQRPNQNQGFNNRPFGNQNQWGNNGNNQGQNQWGTNGNNQGQNQWGTNGNNQGQNQWGNNGNNQGQNQWGNNGNNGNNQGQNQWGTNGNNQGQNQWGTNGDNQGQNQWGTNGDNQGTRPPTQPTTSPTPVQTSTTPSSSGEASEAQRNTCNMNCREIITNEYNPVCGSDSQTYQNRRFLECVANCGIQTEFSYIGTCVTTTQRITLA